MKKRIIVEGPHSNFELWVPCVEKLFIEEGVKGGRSMQEFNKVKAFRVGVGLTQEQMAKAIDVHVNTYRTLEENPTKFNVEQIKKFTEEINKYNPTVKASDIFLI